MGLKNLFLGGKKEQEVIDKMKKHMGLLCSACTTLKAAIKNRDEDLLSNVSDLEREGDIVRREIVSSIYEGAFLPFLRPNICRFVEIVDNALDVTKDAAIEYTDLWLDEETKDDCARIADISAKMCEMLLVAFGTLSGPDDLREKSLAIRIYEKKIDEIKFDLIKRLRTKVTKNFWEGKILSDFIHDLTSTSDLIEDASDYLQIINISLR
ncbi:MAG: TIGR00153 family protein [Thermodesulfobacteriota bacterium]